MPTAFFGFLGLLLALVLWAYFRRYRRLQRERYIRDYRFPRGLYERLRKRRPQLELKDCTLVARALRQFFLAYLGGGRNYVAMPSQLTDDLWHEFILYTKTYEDFCRHAFGGFLHHTPAIALGTEKRDNEGLRRVWWQACREESIDPAKPLRLPLLFAIDSKFGISDGFHYVPDCKGLQTPGDGNVHCGTSFADDSIDGCTDGFGDSGSSSDGSGDAGGGDGGGCGGGD